MLNYELDDNYID